MKPTFAEKKPLSLVETVPHPDVVRFHVNGFNSYLRTYHLGPCSVIVTKEYGKWHLSIAHPTRYPTWDEIAEARYRVIPDDLTMAMMLPPRREYVAIHPNCFQLLEVDRKGEATYVVGE